MYRTIRDNVSAAHDDATSAMIPLIILCAIVAGPVWLVKGCSGEKKRPPVVKPVTTTTTEDNTAPVQTRSLGRRSWDRTKKVWRALTDKDK